MKNIRFGIVAFLIVVFVLSGCVPAPVVVTKVSPTETIPPVIVEELETVELEPTLTSTNEPTPTETPTITPTPEPILWCSDIIDDCYFIGSEFARIFTVMTLPCFENGGECYPPVEDCSKIPPSVVHVLIEDWASAWEQEVNSNPDYSLLDSNLYDSETQYCFVDENLAQMGRNLGYEEYEANKLCLDNEEVPCDIMLLFLRGFHPGSLPRNIRLTSDIFSSVIIWAPQFSEDFEISRAYIPQFKWYEEDYKTVDYFGYSAFAYLRSSSSTGFNLHNENSPLEITVLIPVEVMKNLSP